MPAYLADQTPGRPFKKSTSMPESSAIEGSFVVSEALLALRIAFSTNVEPVSSTSGIYKSLHVTKSTLNPDRISLNSDIFPGFFVAKNIFIKL